MSSREQKTARFEFDVYTLHPRRRVLEKQGEHLRLTPRVFDLLVYLVERAGTAVTKQELLDNVWSDAVVEEGNINRTISTLRRQLGRQADGTDFIETIPRTGYRFLADVTPRADDATAIPTNESGKLDGVVKPVAPSGFRRKLVWLFAGALLVVSITLLLGWVWQPMPTVNASTKNTLVKLLDTPVQELNPSFSADGRIRFGKRTDSKTVLSFSIAADGTDERAENAIADLSFGRWSPDGSKVFYTKLGDGKFYLANSDGSDERAMPFAPGNSTWSPDGTSFMYQAKATDSSVPNNADIYIYTVATGAITRVVESPFFDSDPTFAPDGRSILFISDRDGNFEIYSMDLTTHDTRRLTDNPAHDSFPSFSPDGTQIVFNSDREKENNDVWLMNADGSGVRKITDSPAFEAVPPNCWSPDGTKIVVLSDSDGDEDVYVMNIEPFVPRKIFETEMSGPASPSYSPDGKSILYQTSDGRESEIRIRDADGGTSRLLRRVDGIEAFPTFSPDGKLVLFQGKVGDNTEVCVVGVDGTGFVNLTSSPAKDMHPSFSPDGRLIVFSTSRGGSSTIHQIYVMNADGSEQREVFGDRAMSITPAFSRDGSTIFFANDREDGRVGNFELFAIPFAGGSESRLTIRRRADSLPSISPDGNRIAFASMSDGNSEIYVMNTDGTHLLRLTRDAADDTGPRWSPDGTRIIFSSDRDGKVGVYEIVL